MVNYRSAALDATFSALSDPTRRSILTRLTEGPATVTELARPFEISLPAVSKHLRVLEDAGLLVRERRGRTHICHLNPLPLEEASSWVAAYKKFWEAQLDSLADYVESKDFKDRKWAVWI